MLLPVYACSCMVLYDAACCCILLDCCCMCSKVFERFRRCSWFRMLLHDVACCRMCSDEFASFRMLVYIVVNGLECCCVVLHVCFICLHVVAWCCMRLQVVTTVCLRVFAWCLCCMMLHGFACMCMMLLHVVACVRMSLQVFACWFTSW